VLLPPRVADLPIGVIGVGKHGARYLHHARVDPVGVRVVAISRRDEAAGRAQAAEVGARYHADFHDLIRDPEVRGVVAVLPPTAHPAVVAAAVAEGKPLLIEKPLAISGDEAYALARQVRDKNLPCLMAQTLRFSAVVRMVRDLLPRIGRVHQMILGQSFEPSRLDWLDDDAVSGGGIVLHTGVHLFDLVRHLSDGEVAWAQCTTARIATHRTEDGFVATLGVRGSGGEGLAGLSASRATRSRYGEIRLLGEHGQIVADHALHRIDLVVDREVVLSERVPDVPTVREVLREFAVVAAGAPPSVEIVDGAAAVEIADACYRSARTGARAAVRSEEEITSCRSS
jgi:predicted dehydrogenase